MLRAHPRAPHWVGPRRIRHPHRPPAPEKIPGPSTMRVGRDLIRNGKTRLALCDRTMCALEEPAHPWAATMGWGRMARGTFGMELCHGRAEEPRAAQDARVADV